MGLSFTDKVVIAEDVMVRVIGEEAVVLSLRTERYLGLDPVGTKMWTALHEASSIEAAFSRLAEEYDVAEDVLRQDLSSFVEELLGHSLIEVRRA